ncbi:PolC-type DNA polymerase III [Lactococcus nasutitermitis]|uniref:PolC-type DNA polymerase III n=1 Tax=Lactococcus nasutitermitis TaxID=1652957 RepID=A0ABV9JDH6_9LACT|nr:3'-5' exonuclease [Lactococcus nasutitermitis]
MEKYVVFDFETTGLNAQKNEIIQIGAVKFDENDVEIARFNQLIQPKAHFIPKKITEITQIAWEDVASEPRLADVLPDFLNFLHGNLLIAHNAPFDMGFLYQAIIELDIRNAEHFEVYDTLAESKRLLKMKSYKLERFKDVLGIELRSHDALNDCLITAKLYQYLQEIDHPKPVVENVQGSLFSDFDDNTITVEIRRKIGLPITKDLVYYHKDNNKNWERFDVTGLQVQQEYSVGYSLTLTLYNNEKVRIHSDFFAQMQKVNFVTEMMKEL